MSRKFLDSLRQQIVDQIYTNSEGEVTAANVQARLIDMIDSTIQDEAGISNAAQPDITVNLTAAWVKLDDLIDAPVQAYDTVTGGDGTFLKVDRAAGTVTSATTPGFTYEALGAVTLSSANNEVIEASIGIDGAPGELIASNVGSAGNRPETLFLRRYVPSTPADSEFSIIVRAPDGAATGVEISTRTFGVIILPTNNP